MSEEQPKERVVLQDDSVEGRLERIEAMLREALDLLHKSTGTAGQGGGLGH